MKPCLARAAGIQAELPRKLPKIAKPERRGKVWLLRGPQGWLLERRPERGLLGGMLGLPGDGWDGSIGEAPAHVAWQSVGQVRHVFTHFALELEVFVSDQAANPLRGEWVSADDFRSISLPTVMKKAFDLGSAKLSQR